jgi:cell wall-associated NlpC family hydrolase
MSANGAGVKVSEQTRCGPAQQEAERQRSGPQKRRARLASALLFTSTAVMLAGVFTDSGPAMAATASPASPHARVAGAVASRTQAATQPQYSKKSAVAWALANVNGTYNAFSDDCTDFVSRALAQGGYPYSYIPSVINSNSTNDHYWYYFTYRYGRHYSHSWSVAHDLAVHFVDRKAQRILSPKNAQAGDVIFANWNGTNFSGISHVGIITKMSNGVPQITQHSPSQKNVSLTYWLKHGGRNVHVWIYVP